MKILLGTTNPAKAVHFSQFLDGCGVEFYTLSDLGITEDPTESGKTPEENARIKAAFYGRYFDRVICGDSGLYFDELPLGDARQPGLNVRSPYGIRLDDEEMIVHYSSLIRSLGGKVLAYYRDGFAVYNCGKIFSFMENREKILHTSFYMIDTPSPKRNLGSPLDSLSVYRSTGTYFVERENSIYETTEETIRRDRYRAAVTTFFKKSMGLI